MAALAGQAAVGYARAMACKDEHAVARLDAVPAFSAGIGDGLGRPVRVARSLSPRSSRPYAARLPRMRRHFGTWAARATLTAAAPAQAAAA